MFVLASELNTKIYQIDTEEVEDLSGVGFFEYLAQTVFENHEHRMRGALQGVPCDAVQRKAGRRVADETPSSPSTRG